LFFDSFFFFSRKSTLPYPFGFTTLATKAEITSIPSLIRMDSPQHRKELEAWSAAALTRSRPWAGQCSPEIAGDCAIAAP
jgi:hypothetical protein